MSRYQREAGARPERKDEAVDRLLMVRVSALNPSDQGAGLADILVRHRLAGRGDGGVIRMIFSPTGLQPRTQLSSRRKS
jgi:hypothetical protein